MSDDQARITVDELRRCAPDPVVVVDVRSAEEFAAGHVGGARNIAATDLEGHVEELGWAALVVTVCTKGGGRSEAAAAALRTFGLPNVRFLAGGTLAWLAARGGSERD